MSFIFDCSDYDCKSLSLLVIGARGIPNVEGGAEKNAEAIFPLIASTGVSVTLMGLSGHIKQADYKGVKLAPAPRVKIMKTDKIFYYFYALLYFLFKRPDIVHMQGLGSAIFLLFYKVMGAKTVVRYGSADYMVEKWGLIGRLGFRFSEWQLRFADAVVAVGPALERRLARLGIKDNVHLIPNALDEPLIPDPAPQLPKEPYILAVGRLTPQKNIHNLIYGFKRFQEVLGIRSKLLLIGGVDQQAYKDELDSIANIDVEFLGFIPRNQLGHYYKNATAYVNSSMHEGCSNAVLEAISYKTPVLLSDIPENRDFGLTDKHYFDPSSEDSIVNSLKLTFENREQFVVESNHFLSWEDVARRTRNVYSSLFKPQKSVNQAAIDKF